MHFVYVLRSLKNSQRIYIGLTTRTVAIRLVEHNAGDSRYTNMHRPWKLEMYIAFSSKQKAEKFEEYLKHGSGSAFLKRHFLNN